MTIDKWETLAFPRTSLVLKVGCPMAKPLVFQFGDKEYPLHLTKIDRSKLYGSKEVEVIDESEQACELATLAEDGRTIIGKGGTGLGWVDADGRWCSKSELKPFNVDGDEIEPVKSSFNATIKLFETASAEEYLQHNIRLVYELKFEGPSESPDSASDLAELIDALKDGSIFQFPYSYRGGLEADVAFMLLNEEGNLILAVGNPTDIFFVGIQSAVAAEADTGTSADEESLMDFDMI